MFINGYFDWLIDWLVNWLVVWSTSSGWLEYFVWFVDFKYKWNGVFHGLHGCEVMSLLGSTAPYSSSTNSGKMSDPLIVTKSCRAILLSVFLSFNWLYISWVLFTFYMKLFYFSYNIYLDLLSKEYNIVPFKTLKLFTSKPIMIERVSMNVSQPKAL